MKSKVREDTIPSLGIVPFGNGGGATLEEGGEGSLWERASGSPCATISLILDNNCAMSSFFSNNKSISWFIKPVCMY